MARIADALDPRTGMADPKKERRGGNKKKSSVKLGGKHSVLAAAVILARGRCKPWIRAALCNLVSKSLLGISSFLLY